MRWNALELARSDDYLALTSMDSIGQDNAFAMHPAIIEDEPVCAILHDDFETIPTIEAMIIRKKNKNTNILALFYTETILF